MTNEKVKELFFQQRVCWVTREEDDVLNHTKTYKSHRPNPLEAYKECGIEIYELEKEDLSNIMIPTFSKPNELSDKSEKLMNLIKSEIIKMFPEYCVHWSASYIQIWKNSWNNRGKQGVHFELRPYKSQGFKCIHGNDKFAISFNLHNETNTRDIIKGVERKNYFKKEYSFLGQEIPSSIKMLLEDIQKIINLDEHKVDLAHKNFSIKKI